MPEIIMFYIFTIFLKHYNTGADRYIHRSVPDIYQVYINCYVPDAWRLRNRDVWY